MDKPQDPKKVIHSNNYLSFWIKKESLTNGKLNMEGIDRYFDILSNPRVKYKNAKDSKMYDYIFPVVGEVNQEKLASRSPVPWPWTAEMAMGSPRPRL